MPPDRDGDEALCARAAAGDRHAFGLLVSRHERRLRAFLVHVAGPGLADELAQEAFVKAWQRAGQYRGQAGFASWLAAIGWRCFLDRLRRERSQARRAEAAAQQAQPDPQATADERIDLARALASLDPDERACLVLCDGHGWSHGEAAAILGMPLGTLKSKVARAKSRCRAMLTGEA